MPRPWFRSRLLWLSVPGFAFLLWAWWDSGRFDSGVRLTPEYRQLYLRQRGGELMSYWWWNDDPLGYAHPNFGPRLEWEREPTTPDVLPETVVAGFHLPEDAVFHRHDANHDLEYGTGYNSGVRIFAVAHGIVVVGYALLVGLAVTLRQRRKRRPAKAR